MAALRNYLLQARRQDGAVFSLGGIQAEDDDKAMIIAAKTVRGMLGGPNLEDGDVISIISPEGSTVGAPAGVPEFIKWDARP